MQNQNGIELDLGEQEFTSKRFKKNSHSSRITSEIPPSNPAKNFRPLKENELYGMFPST